MRQPIRKGAGILSGVAAVWNFLLPLWHWFVKIVVHFFTRKSELERILVSGTYSRALQSRFSASLRSSRQLAGIKRAVFAEIEFDVPAILEAVIVNKGISRSGPLFRSTLFPNLQLCLEAINHTNTVIRNCVRLSATPYDSQNARHEQMLEKLWGDLKPGVTRVGGRLTKEWGDIGFQGADPASDFRGMGLLGLVQLCYFAEHRSATARLIVEEADLPYKGLPFAITGINITNLVLDMLTERRFADRFPAQEDAAIAQLHNIYCDVYCLFSHWWQAANPATIMEFTAVFGRFHVKLNEYLAQHGVVPPSSWVNSAR